VEAVQVHAAEADAEQAKRETSAEADVLALNA
jgi:hypothetical protein